MTYQSALAALAEPMRRTLLERIIEKPRAVGEIAKDLPITAPAVSQHLKVLRESGLIREERQGTRRIYHAESAALGELRAYVDGMWRATLDAFAETASKDGKAE